MKSQRELENELRIATLNAIQPVLEELYGEVYKVRTIKGGTSANYSLACPCLDSERNEAVIKIDVSIPRGERADGTYEPYDVYSEAECFQAELDEMAAKKNARLEKAKQQATIREQHKKERKKKYETDTERHRRESSGDEPPTAEGLGSNLASDESNT